MDLFLVVLRSIGSVSSPNEILRDTEIMEASLRENYHINTIPEERVCLKNFMSNQVSIEGHLS